MADADLKELRDEYDAYSGEWEDIRKEAKKDMLVVAGRPWDAMDPDGLKAREAAKRPHLSLDEIGQFVNQLINDIRQNKRAIKVTAVGFGANDKTADFRQNLIRQIEYRSNAQQAYTTMFENAVQRSYGYLRIKPVFAGESGKSFDQELRIEPIANPDTVTPDPWALKTDGSDWTRLWVTEGWNRKDYKAKWPKATVQTFTPEIVSSAPSWFHGAERLTVGERWMRLTKKKKLLLVQAPAPKGVDPRTGQPLPAPPPMPLYEDELAKMAPGAKVLRDRECDVPYIQQQITNGLEILEENDFPGTSIPFVACYGKVLYVDEGGGSKRQILSLVRLARDPYMLYCYYRTCEAELVGMTPKTPFIGYEGQFAGHEEDWQKVSKEPLAYLEAKPVIDGVSGGPLPLPQRQPYDPPIQALEIGAESARRAIQAAMGTSPLPTQAQRKNEKSGVALRQIEDNAQKGSYHFIDHYEDALTRTGAILNELIPYYYDTARDVTVRKPDDSPEVIRINDPQTQEGEAIDATQGEHDVTMSVGPAFESEREAASAFVDTILSSPLLQLLEPPKAQKVVALAVRLKGVGPLGDEIADTISPPQQEGPNPQQAQQLQQENEALKAQLGQAAKVIETKQIEQKAKTDAAKIQAQAQFMIQKMKDATAMAVAKINLLGKGIQADHEAELEAIALAHEAEQNERDRAHESALAAQEAAHGQEMADQAHQQGLEQQDATTANAMVQAEHAQAIQPPEAEAE